MPSSIEVKHPNKDLTIKFTEVDHSYIDSKNGNYTSVTTLIGKVFPKFDADAVAKKVSEKKGVDAEELKRQWAEAGEIARTMGTRMHETCEAILLGRDMPHEATDEKEQTNFNLCIERCKSFINDRKNGIIEEYRPEYLVFSPKVKLAGSIDLLVKYDDNHYHIYDWKNLSKPLNRHGYGSGIVEPTYDIPDTNYWHYALQLYLYEIILKIEGYIDFNAKVDHTLLVVNNNELTEVDMDDVMHAATKLVKWHTELKNELI